MAELETVDDILEYAIAQEDEAAEFYANLAERTERPGMKQVFEGLARQEIGHRAKLQSIKDGVIAAPMRKQFADLKIAEYLADVKPDPQMDYQSALTFAMKREAATFKMYNDMAERADDPDVKEILLSLAQEEARHKLRIETEYDEHVLSEN